MRKVECGMCGKVFSVEGFWEDSRRKYCTPECRKLASNHKGVNFLEQKAEAKRRRRKKEEEDPNSLISINIRAREAGMSYGKYVSKYNIK